MYRSAATPVLGFTTHNRCLQTVSKTGAHLRVLARRREELETRFNLLIRGAKRRIGVRRRLVTLVQRFRVRFPCATATVLNFHSFVPALWSSPNCLQEWRPGKARKKLGRLHPERVAGNPAARPSHA